MQARDKSTTVTHETGARRPAAGLRPEELRRVRALLLRAMDHTANGPLRAGLARGMLTTDPEEQRQLEAIARELWSGHIPRSAVAGAQLAQLARRERVGALAMMACLADEPAIRAVAACIVDDSAPRLRRLAAIRGALIAWQSARDQQAPSPIPLMAALRRAAREGDEQIRFMALFVLAMLGRREVRGALEEGLRHLQSAPLLSYCVLGLREVGTESSVRVLRHLAPRTSGALAQTTHETIQTLEMRLRPPLVEPRRPALVLPANDLQERETVRIDRAELARRLFPQRSPVLRQ